MAAAHPVSDPQSAAAVLMVRPACFGFNRQTAASNALQRPADGARDTQLDAAAEFEGVVRALRSAGIEVLVADDTPQPAKPDAIFPNNWVSFHRDGTVALYPMMAPNRRPERRVEILDMVVRSGYRATRTVDFTHREAQGKFLEGTGSLVLDRSHRVAYACASPRTDLDVLAEFAQVMDFELVTFDAADAMGQAVYHTNVLMVIGSGFAVVCGEAIRGAQQRAAVFAKLRAGDLEIIDVSWPQVLQFVGNMLELAGSSNKLLALSATALAALRPEQRTALAVHARLLPMPIPTIERIGGGGVRCMLAEIHLPKRAGRALRVP